MFDLGWLQAHNLYPKGHVFCTMLASKLHNNGKAQTKHRLDVLAKRYLGKTLSKEQQASDWSAEQLSQEQLTYAAKDVEVLLELVPRINHFLRKHDLFDAFHLECGALPAMAQMWRTGLPWNRDALEKLRKAYLNDIEKLGKEFLLELDEALPEGHKLPRESSERLEYLKDEIKRMDMDPAYIAECKAEIEELETQPAVFNLRAKETGSKRLGTKKLAGFNLNSPKQLIEKFDLVLGEPPKDEKTGKPSASRSALQSYAADHHVVQTYLAWKKAENADKWLNLYRTNSPQMVSYAPAIYSLEPQAEGCPASTRTTNKSRRIKSSVPVLKLLKTGFLLMLIFLKWNYDSRRQSRKIKR